MGEQNLKLWNSVSTTNPNHTTKAKVSGQQRTTVKAIFQKEKATEIFGAQGQKWGVAPGSEDYTRLHLNDGEIMLQYTGLMYYNYDGERGEIPLAAAIMEAAIVKRGKPDQYLRLDHEAIKKVRTDAMTKALSELGFNADIFKGWYDDRGYQEYASSAIQEEQQEQAEEKAISEAEEYAQWKENAMLEYGKLTTNKAVTTLHTQHVRKATKIGDSNGVKEFSSMKEKQIAVIKARAEKEKENA